MAKRRPAAGRADGSQTPLSLKSQEGKIRQLIDKQSREELADLVWSLVERFPELREEFQERIALSESNVEHLVADTRRELTEVTSEPGWRGNWDDEGHIPDYSRLQRRFERLVGLGQYDVVAELGRELISLGLEQVSRSDDEGETGSGFAECMPSVFEAVSRSNWPPADKILFAIDADLEDEYDLIDDKSDVVLEADWSPGDWAKVADRLATRLREEPAGSQESFSRDYKRNQVSTWMAHALERAGRQDEVLTVYQREARETGSYERLVRFLIESKRITEAEQWAREGIEQTWEKQSGTASTLANLLCDVACRRRAWDEVAAHAAWRFFERPSSGSFNDLMKAAAKAKCEEQVRVAAMRFLETGDLPMRQVATRGRPSRLETDKSWPLPWPDYLVPLVRLDDPHRQKGPHFDVLLHMALDAKRPDDVLHWYDKLSAGRTHKGVARPRYSSESWSDRVAAAVASTHPDRALAIYQTHLQAHLPQADSRSYEAAADYLKKMRPILKSVGREDEWTQMLADIRLKYRNRPRFMDKLRALDRGLP